MGSASSSDVPGSLGGMGILFGSEICISEFGLHSHSSRDGTGRYPTRKPADFQSSKARATDTYQVETELMTYDLSYIAKEN
jgi:hypothetical protein